MTSKKHDAELVAFEAFGLSRGFRLVLSRTKGPHRYDTAVSNAAWEGWQGHAAQKTDCDGICGAIIHEGCPLHDAAVMPVQCEHNFSRTTVTENGGICLKCGVHRNTITSTGNTEERTPLVDPAVVEYAKRFADGLEPTSSTILSDGRHHEKFRKAINDALSSYHIQQQTSVDDRGFMLVDALTPAWESDITKGSMELDSLADYIFDALPLGDNNE